jgi:hypothetical protein
MFEIVDLKATFYVYSVGMFIIYVCALFHKPCSTDSFIIAMTRKAGKTFGTAAVSSLYVLQDIPQHNVYCLKTYYNT